MSEPAAVGNPMILLEDLLESYADRYCTAIAHLDSHGQVDAPCFDRSPFFQLVSNETTRFVSQLEFGSFHLKSLTEPLILDIYPGLQSIVSRCTWDNHDGYLWAGPFLVTGGRAALAAYVTDNVQHPSPFLSAVQTISEVPADAMEERMHRFRLICDLVSREQYQHATAMLSNAFAAVMHKTISGTMPSQPEDAVEAFLTSTLTLVHNALAHGYARCDADGVSVRRVIDAHDKDSEHRQTGVHFRYGEGLLGLTAATGAPGYWTHVRHDVRAAFLMQTHAAGDVVYTFPIWVRDRMVGVWFGVACSEVANEVRLALKNISDVFGMVLANAAADRQQRWLLAGIQSLRELDHTVQQVAERKHGLLAGLEVLTTICDSSFAAVLYREPGDETVRVSTRGPLPTNWARIAEEIRDTSFGFQTTVAQFNRRGTVAEMHVLPIHTGCLVHGILVVPFASTDVLAPCQGLLIWLCRILAGLFPDDGPDAPNLEGFTRIVHSLTQHWANDVYQDIELRLQRGREFADWIHLSEDDKSLFETACRWYPYDKTLIARLPIALPSRVHAVLNASHMENSQSSDVVSQLLQVTRSFSLGQTPRTALEQQFDWFLRLRQTSQCDLALPDGRVVTNGIHRLTGRETELLLLVARGWSNRQIASTLHLSQHTVKNHLTNIFHKLGVNGRLEAIRLMSPSL